MLLLAAVLRGPLAVGGLVDAVPAAPCFPAARLLVPPTPSPSTSSSCPALQILPASDSRQAITGHAHLLALRNRPFRGREQPCVRPFPLPLSHGALSRRGTASDG